MWCAVTAVWGALQNGMDAQLADIPPYNNTLVKWRRQFVLTAGQFLLVWYKSALLNLGTPFGQGRPITAGTFTKLPRTMFWKGDRHLRGKSIVNVAMSLTA